MIELLAEEARPPSAKKLTARAEWRVRSGDYRVLYRRHDEVLTVIVVDAGHGREIYTQPRFFVRSPDGHVINVAQHRSRAVLCSTAGPESPLLAASE